jgi:hypothetical protein
MECMGDDLGLEGREGGTMAGGAALRNIHKLTKFTDLRAFRG